MEINKNVASAITSTYTGLVKIPKIRTLFLFLRKTRNVVISENAGSLFRNWLKSQIFLYFLFRLLFRIKFRLHGIPVDDANSQLKYFFLLLPNNIIFCVCLHFYMFDTFSMFFFKNARFFVLTVFL